MAVRIDQIHKDYKMKTDDKSRLRAENERASGGRGMSDYQTTDYQASISLFGNEVTIKFKFKSNELAGHMADELIDAYYKGEPVTITLSQPANQ